MQENLNDTDMLKKISSYGPFAFGMGNIGPHYPGNLDPKQENGANIQALRIIRDYSAIDYYPKNLAM